MDENMAEGEEDDHDIIHLLNTKSKNREILSITNAAVDAVYGHQHAKTRTSLVSLDNTKDKEEMKENHSISDSFTSTSSKNVSFNGRHRVRVSSSLLREIKSPLERSDVVNRMGSSESGTMSSSTLFASQSSSNQSSVQATGPVPTVIKYSPELPVQMDMEVITSHQSTTHRTGTPVVVKNSAGYFASGTSGHSLSPQAVLIETEKNHQNARTNHTNRDSVKHIRTSEQTSESGAEKGANVSHTESDSKINNNNDEGIVLSSSTSITKKPTNLYGTVEESKNYLTKGGNQRGRGLCQGAPSSNVVHVDLEKGQVKAVSFSLSEREKATREMLSKKQESKGVIRRVVQPKLVTAKSSDEEQTEIQRGNKEKTSSVVTSSVSPENIAVDGSAVQLPSELEKQMKSLRSTLDVIEAQCQESRIWQEQHRQELERNNKQRDERRLQNLEDMQKQLLECQLKNAHYVPPMSSQLLPMSSNVLPTWPTTSTVTGTTEELSKTQVKPKTQNFQENSHPWRPPSSGNTERELVQGVSPNNLQYSEAAKHKMQSAFKTSVYSKPSDALAQSGLKRKFIRNTRTQTSPQESSSFTSSSSSEIISPLDTPLPRKRPPVPMSRDSKSNLELSRKHVHFDTPNVKNSENFDKRRRDGRHDKANLAGATAGGHIQTSYPSNKTRDIERQNSPYKRSGSGDYIVNDIGKLRQELKDALKETENTKLSLKNLHNNIHSQISDDDVLAPPDHTQPYPIDAYLRATRDIQEEPETPRVQESTLPETGDQSRRLGGYLADGWGVLREVQKRRETLETNLLSLTRRHEEEGLYRVVNDVPNGENTGEVLRIRKLVGKKIGEIDAEIQSELQEEERQKLASQKETSVENTKITKRPTRSSSGVPLSTERRARSRNIGKENQPRGGKPAAKPKTTKAVSKQPQTKRLLNDPSYVSRVYGRHDHVPRRTTLKSSSNHHQSPAGQTKPVTTTGDTSKHQRRWDDSVSSLSEDYHHLPQSTSEKPNYYFQPSFPTSHISMKTHLRNVQTPLPGQLLSMAIPLGKPKRDPSLRLPVSTNEDTLELPPSKFQTVGSSVKQPNVAVITIKDEDWLSEDEQHRKHKNVTPGKEVGTALETQILPNVDIDTSGFTDVSEGFLPEKGVGPQILSWPDPLRRPGASEYEEFKDYEEVTNVKDNDMEDEKDDKESRHEGESVISLHGANTGWKLSYQGPVFPPENIPASAGLDIHDEFEGDVTKAASQTLESKAMEWVEQELLARIVSEMAPPLPDPTATLNRSQPSSFITTSDVSDDDAAPDLLGAIGLRGMQLFVDAGIPVDNDLVRNLISEVLREKICSMIGFPKPQAEPSPEQQPSRDHTEDEPLSEESTRVETPVRSPSSTSLLASRSPSHVSTPEQSNSEEYSSSLLLSDDIKKSVVRSDHVEDDEIEEGYLDDFVPEHPVVTPVVTPKSSPRQYVNNLHTPEVSEQDLPESEETGVLTPEITVSIRDRTPTPQDVDDDLKEQTLMEDDTEEKNEEPDIVIPAVKFIPELKPSIVATTNSPSSIMTTTTYSTQSTMGTFGTDDEISEGEQLQPFVHVGLYSEGEFAAPSALGHVSENMETMREIPDDIFDSFRNINKKHDVFKHALSGLLHLEGEEDDRAIGGTGEETITSTDGQRRVGSESQLSEGSLHDDICQSEGEVALGRDVVADLLTQMRRPPTLNRKIRGTASQEQEDDSSTSLGEVVQRHRVTLSHGLPGVVSEDDLSVGEVARQNPNPAGHLLQLSPKQGIDRPQGSSVFDSDENNNESDRSSSIHNGHHQSWHATQDMVTPRKTTTTVFPRVVHVTEAAQHESTPTGLTLSARRRESGSEGNITMETLSDIHPNPPGAGQAQATHIKLTLPSIDPSGSPTLSEEALELDLDDTTGDASSISGGEI